MANRLLRVLAVRLRVNRASPLVTKHMAGKQNHLGDIPSQSFGFKAEWHHPADREFLSFFNQTFPLPNQLSWTGFRLRSAVVTKVMSELLTQASPMDEWRQLRKIGQKFGGSGKTIADLTRSIRTWTAVTLTRWPELRSTTEGASARGGEDDPSPLEQWHRTSAISRRRSVWTEGHGRCTNHSASIT